MATHNNNVFVTALVLLGIDSDSFCIERICNLFSPDSNQMVRNYDQLKRVLHPDLIKLIEFFGYDPEEPTDKFDDDHTENIEDALILIRKLFASKTHARLARKFFEADDGQSGRTDHD